MNINKVGYFNHRNQALSGLSSREMLGEREVLTLLTMLEANNATCDSLNGKLVADLGCGDQYIRKPVERRGGSYMGIDIDECNLETDGFPIGDSTCDIVICLALIEHLFDPGHFLTEVKRVLKPGGHLWMSTPDIEACGAKFWNDPTHVHPYTRLSLCTVLRMNGYTEVLVTPNYRCKPVMYYKNTNFSFFRARYLMPFKATTRWPLPEFLKGQCTGLFSLARKPL
jgi:SAM-dependent methyltransferase